MTTKSHRQHRQGSTGRGSIFTGNAHRTICVRVRAIADRSGFWKYSRWHRATDAAVAGKPVGRSGSRRRVFRKRPEDDRVSEEHERLRRHERNLRRVLQRCSARRARPSKSRACQRTHWLKSKRSRCARKDNPVNIRSTYRPPPKMTEAFEHPAGSIAAGRLAVQPNGGGNCFTSMLRPAPATRWKNCRRPNASPVGGSSAIATTRVPAPIHRSRTCAR